ncbi:hypothetical protein lbkm_1193 [Lachnospiraceae bacterium KM106-2]|nr:hypothetical protein lbkm_1193 [Lachnospiraceae bacterium KM106-2]
MSELQQHKNVTQGYRKVTSILMIICSVFVIVLACLYLFGIWKDAINLMEPMLGITILMQGVLQWKEHRTYAIISFGCAIFIFVVSIIVLYL